MSYWSDEREDLNETIRMINQGAIRRAQENAELKEEIEKLKMKIKNMKDAKENPTPIHGIWPNRDQMSLPFAEWGHGRAMPGAAGADSELYNETNNENPKRKG